MTRDPREITPEQQAEWWANLPASWHCYLLNTSEGAIGYGLRRTDEEGRDWLSGGLDPLHRGKGYGRALFQALIRECEGEAWLEVWQENVAAVNLYRSLGFVVEWQDVDRSETKMTMKRPIR